MALHDLSVWTKRVPTASCAESTASFAFGASLAFAFEHKDVLEFSNLIKIGKEMHGLILAFSFALVRPFAHSFALASAFAANNPSDSSRRLLHEISPPGLALLVLPEEFFSLFCDTARWKLVGAISD